MQVRKTRNLEVIKRLDAKIFEGDKEYRILGGKDHVWWLAYVDGKIAGFAGLKIYHGDMTGYLMKAGILPEYRGMGLQRALIDVRDREAKRLKLEVNITYTAHWNFASANNLIASGYRLYDPQERWGLKSGLYFYKPFKYRG